MKTLLTVTLLINFNIIWAQDVKIVLDNNLKYNAEAIYEIEGKTQSEIYQAIIEWISYSFQNTEAVIQSQIENEMVRMNGASPGVIDGAMNFRYGLAYTIQFDIKEGRIRLQAYSLQTTAADEFATRNDLEESMIKKGQRRTGQLYDNIENGTNEELNRIFKSAVLYIKNGGSDDNW